MRNNKKAYDVGILVIGIMAVAAVSSVSAEVELSCADCDVHRVQGTGAGTKVIVEVLTGGGACPPPPAQSASNIENTQSIVAGATPTQDILTPAHPVTAQTTSTHPITVEPTLTHFMEGQTTMAQPTTTQPAPVQLTPGELTLTQTTLAQPTTTQSTLAQPTPGEPTLAQTTQAQPIQAQPTLARVEDPSTVENSIKMLCKGALYNEACDTILTKVAIGKGNTAEVIKAGISVALDMVTKIFNLTDTLVPKIKSVAKPEIAEMAVDDCKELFRESIYKLEQAITQFGQMNSNTGESCTFRLRLWLSDVLTFYDNCMDTLGEADTPEFQKILKGDVVNATQVTMTVLDVFTDFTKALDSVGFELNTDNIHKAIGTFGVGKVGSGRRLLGGASEMMGKDGAPRWLSASDRRLLNLNEEGRERVLDELAPNAVVAQDGSGQFKTIEEALNAYNPKSPLPPGGKYVIYVKAGIYNEHIVIESNKKNIYMYGDGPTKTIVTGNKSNKGGVTTSKTATFAVQAPFFFCKDMAFENTAGPEGHQAVALRANNEQQVFLNCHFNAYQDTLYVQGGSQFFRDCVISGTVDFIFGNGACVIQGSTIIVRMPMPNQFNAVTAQGRTGPSMPTGLVIQDCVVQPDPALDKVKIKTYLGRPWKAYARTVFMESELGDMIQPVGYTEFDGTPNGNTVDSFYGEFGNRGPGSETNLRVKWPNVKVLTREEAQVFTVGAFLPDADTWLKPNAVPYYAGFKV